MALTFDLGAPWLHNGQAYARLVRTLLGELITVNRESIRRNPLPRILLSGVRYSFDGTGGQFRDVYKVIEHGSGDCGSLPAWRAAELQAQGERASLRVVWKDLAGGDRLFHVQVRRGNGSVEDTCRLLGMRTPWSFQR